MRVVAIDSPGRQYPLGVQVFARSAYVINHLVTTVLDYCAADPSGDAFQDLFPGYPLPFPFSPITDPAQGVEDPIRVGNLVQGSRALGTVPATAGRVKRMSLQLADLVGVFVHICEEATGRLAVEACSRNEAVTALHFPRPFPGVVLFPVIPVLDPRSGP